MATESVSSVLQVMDPMSAAELLSHLAPVQAVATLSMLPADDAATVLAALPADSSASLLRQIDPSIARVLVDLLPPDLAAPVRTLMSYPSTSAGGVMDPLVLTAPLAATAADVRSLVARFPDHLYYYVYVIDDDHRLAGVLDLAELFQAQAAVLVRDVMHSPVSSLSAEASLDAVFAHPAWRHFDALPVVADGQRFVGAIRHRRMRQLLEAHKATGQRDPGVQTVMALGEIYWLGLCGLLQGIASTASEPASVPGGRPS
jgi:magnesium transporter